MKKISRSAASLLAVGIGVLVYAPAVQPQSVATAESFTATVYPIPNTPVVRVMVTKVPGKRFYLCLRDKQHNIIYFDEMKKQATYRQFELNLTPLANGTYYFDFSDGRKAFVTKTLQKEQVVLAQSVANTHVICMN